MSFPFGGHPKFGHVKAWATMNGLEILDCVTDEPAKITIFVKKDGTKVPVANLLKVELKRAGVTYAQLVEKLEAIGVHEKEVNIRNKLARGKFSASFLLYCLEAIGVSELRI